MIKDILFTVYALLIPAVPLWGVEKYRRDANGRRMRICFGIFAAQLFVSVLAVLKYAGTI